MQLPHLVLNPTPVLKWDFPTKSDITSSKSIPLILKGMSPSPYLSHQSRYIRRSQKPNKSILPDREFWQMHERSQQLHCHIYLQLLLWRFLIWYRNSKSATAVPNLWPSPFWRGSTAFYRTSHSFEHGTLSLLLLDHIQCTRPDLQVIGHLKDETQRIDWSRGCTERRLY